MTRPHHISIMGSTGSIGKSALDVVRHANACGDQKFKIVALAAGSDAEGLAAQAREFDADVAVIADETKIDELRSRLAGTNVSHSPHFYYSPSHTRRGLSIENRQI